MHIANTAPESATAKALPHDPNWPRTGAWPPPANANAPYDLTLVGVPTHLTSISKSNAHLTPQAVRQALRRYSGHSVAANHPGAPCTAEASQQAAQLVLEDALRICDAGDIADPDSLVGEAAAIGTLAKLSSRSQLLVALGGDNALTYPVALGASNNDLSRAGLITVDAHHDLRDGRSNGSPVRRLIAAGLDPARIVQIGIADFANSRTYRERANAWGITVIHQADLINRPTAEIVASALEIAGSGGGAIHVDIDVDVCDRAIAPACPASLPGGISAWQLRQLCRLFAADARVRSQDFAEVDASADAPDGRTVRLVALCVLEAAAGLASRSTSGAA